MSRTVTGRAESSARRARAAIRDRRVCDLPLALLAVVLVVDVWWIVREHRSPPWDQAHYPDVMWRYRTTLSQPIGYEHCPGPVDYAPPILAYLAAMSRSHAGTLIPRKVCILETDPIVNANTLGWLTDVDGLPFTYFDQFMISPKAALLNQLAACDFALYIPPEKIPPTLVRSRLPLLNAQSAASRMTPEMFARFRGPSKRFPADDGLHVTVLERTATTGTSTIP